MLKLGIKIKFIDKILDFKIYNSSKKKSALMLGSLVLMFIGGSLIPESNELEVNSRTIASEESQLESEEELALKEQEEKKVASNIPNSLVASVVRVVDGDTIIVSINGNEERVRFLLVDTPEIVHPNKPVEPFGSEAQRKALGIWSIENYAQESQQSSQKSLSNSTHPPSTNTETNNGKGLIKGNISSSGEKNISCAWGAFYDRTIIDEAAGERWFHTEN